MDTDVQKKEEKGVTLLDNLYRFVIAGVPSLSEPVEELAGYYLTHHPDNPEIAIKNFILNQKMKCSTTGFLTGLGGLITLPVTLPADLASSLYMELRMIAGIAYIRGYDLKDDTVKTLLYLCLVGNAAGDVIKQVGIKISGRYTLKKILPKLSREILVKINKAVGFRLVTKGGTKGVINLAKWYLCLEVSSVRPSIGTRLLSMQNREAHVRGKQDIISPWKPSNFARIAAIRSRETAGSVRSAAHRYPIRVRRLPPEDNHGRRTLPSSDNSLSRTWLLFPISSHAISIYPWMSHLLKSVTTPWR